MMTAAFLGSEEAAALEAAGFTHTTDGTEAPRPVFSIDNDNAMGWWLKKIRAKYDQLAHLEEVFKTQKAILQSDLKNLQAFEDQARDYALSKLERKADGSFRRKTIAFGLDGCVSFRTVPSRYAVDEKELLGSLTGDDLPPYVVTVKKIDRRAVSDYVRSTGDLPKGVEFIAARESASFAGVKFPGDARDPDETES